MKFSKLHEEPWTHLNFYVKFLKFSKFLRPISPHCFSTSSSLSSSLLYMISRSFNLKSNMKSNILFIFVEDRFRIFARMIKFSFRHIVNLIKNDEVFHNQFYISQTTIKTQLLFALYKLRHFDNANAFRHVSMLWNVFENHVLDCTKKVIKTLYKLKNDYVCWFDEKRRRQKNLKNDEK